MVNPDNFWRFGLIIPREDLALYDDKKAEEGKICAVSLITKVREWDQLSPPLLIICRTVGRFNVNLILEDEMERSTSYSSAKGGREDMSCFLV